MSPASSEQRLLLCTSSVRSYVLSSWHESQHWKDRDWERRSSYSSKRQCTAAGRGVQILWVVFTSHWRQNKEIGTSTSTGNLSFTIHKMVASRGFTKTSRDFRFLSRSLFRFSCRVIDLGTEGVRSQVQAAYTKFLHRVHGVTLSDRMCSLEIRITLNEYRGIFVRIEFRHVTAIPHERLMR